MDAAPFVSAFSDVLPRSVAAGPTAGQQSVGAHDATRAPREQRCIQKQP